MTEAQRLTLVACGSPHGEHWTDRRVVLIDVGAIPEALSEPALDAERLILDRVASAEAFLHVLATLPREFGGDVLCIDERGGGFLSATGRGGDRVLYTLNADDVRFYLRLIA